MFTCVCVHIYREICVCLCLVLLLAGVSQSRMLQETDAKREKGETERYRYRATAADHHYSWSSGRNFCALTYTIDNSLPPWTILSFSLSLRLPSFDSPAQHAHERTASATLDVLLFSGLTFSLCLPLSLLLKQSKLLTCTLHASCCCSHSMTIQLWYDETHNNDDGAPLTTRNDVSNRYLFPSLVSHGVSILLHTFYLLVVIREPAGNWPRRGHPVQRVRSKKLSKEKTTNIVKRS